MSSLSKADYLKRYLSDAEQPTKKKRRKKTKTSSKAVQNMVIHDENDSWKKPVNDMESDDDDKPNIIDGNALLASVDFDDSPTIYSSTKPSQVASSVFKGKTSFQAVVNSEAGGSPPRRPRHDSDDDDASPPRRSLRHDSDDDASPPRRSLRHDSDDDASPPRRSLRHDSDDDASPPRRSLRHDSDDDASPPRRSLRHDSDDDASPPRRRVRQGLDDDASPPRRRVRQGLDDDASPPRRSRSQDLGRSAKHTRRPVVAAAVEAAPKSGLQSAQALREENERLKQREKEKFAKMAADESGIGAETVHRDKSGKRLDPKLERLRKRAEEKKQQEKIEAKASWGKGKTQLQEREQQRADELREMTKPFARHADDTDMNQLLKDEIRADDPMAAYMLKQRERAVVASGRTVKPKYKGAWPGNRYNIPPGYRWDGRDRSNGFEKKLMLFKNKASATKKDAYRWSSENM